MNAITERISDHQNSSTYITFTLIFVLKEEEKKMKIEYKSHVKETNKLKFFDRNLNNLI